MSRRYGIVRVIASILKVLGVVALVAGLILAVVALFVGGSVPPIVQTIKSMGAIVALLAGVVWFVQLYAFGSILSLLVDIEENTRELAAEPTGSAAPVDLA